MRNLTFQEWAVTMIVLLMAGWTGSVLGVTVLNGIAAGGLAVLAVERLTNLRRVRRLARSTTCGQYIESHSGARSHPCELPTDGHTTHRCGHGDCSWGN